VKSSTTECTNRQSEPQKQPGRATIDGAKKTEKRNIKLQRTNGGFNATVDEAGALSDTL